MNQENKLHSPFLLNTLQHHDHDAAVDMADLVMDPEHMLDDLGPELFSPQELNRMDVDEKGPAAAR